jgi:hypothetical protein
MKHKWSNPEFREKMTKRKVRKLPDYKLISPTGETIIINGVKEILRRFNFSRNLFYKFLDTNTPVPIPKKQANREVNQNTVGWTFYKIKD